MKKRTALFLCALTGSFVHAQTFPAVKDSLEKLEDSLRLVTVTATRTTKDIMDVGRSVTVITNEQIKQASCGTVAELLSQQEGIYIVGTGQNPGNIQSLSMRGSDNNNTAIMIDGVPLNDPSTDHSELDLSELSLADVDRIEIVRGSHSTLYGSSSIGGVINIITKKNYAPGFHVNASVTGGEFGPNTSEFDGNVLLNYTFKNGLYATAGYHYYADKGLNATVDTFSHPLSYQMNPDNDNFNKSEPFVKLGFVNKNWDIYAEYKNIIQTSDADAAAFEDAKNATDHFVRDFYTWGLTYKVNESFHFSYTGSYSHDYRIYNKGLDTDEVYGYPTSDHDMYTGTYMFHDLKAQYNLKTSHFIVGGGYYNESMANSTNSYSAPYGTFTDNPDTIKFKQSTSDVYAQADINGGTFSQVLNPYNLLLGARYTSNSISGTNISYEINPSVKVGTNSLLFLSYSTGFSTPSLYELFTPDKYGDNPSTSVTLGNPSLKAETSSSMELGVKHSVSANLFFTISWFKTIVNNHIDYVALWNNNKPVDSLAYGDNSGYTYINLGQEITQGFELSAFLKISPKISVTGNVSLLSSTLNYSLSNVDTAQTHNAKIQIYDGGVFVGQMGQSTGLLRRPGAMGNFAITWKPIPKLSLTAKARYVGSSFDAVYSPSLGVNYYGADAFVNIGDYTLLDILASYDITKQLSCTLRAENLLNTTYSEILGYTTRGRSFYLNIRFSL